MTAPTASDLLATLEACGAVLELRGETLHVEAPPEVLTPPLVEALRQHKPAILEHLRARPACDECRTPLAPGRRKCARCASSQIRALELDRMAGEVLRLEAQLSEMPADHPERPEVGAEWVAALTAYTRAAREHPEPAASRCGWCAGPSPRSMTPCATCAAPGSVPDHLSAEAPDTCQTCGAAIDRDARPSGPFCSPACAMLAPVETEA